MPVTINVNRLSLVHEQSGGVSAATLPNVCATPDVGLVPYPSTALSKDLAGGSRDAAEVDKYVADPLCGFAVTTTLWVDVLDALGAIARPERQARIPKDLPIYVFSGSEDPVSEKTKSLEQLLAAYRLAGIRDVAHRFYPGARHETLNETNRDEVTRDLITWLDAHSQARITTH